MYTRFGRSPVSLNTLLSTKPHSCTNLSLAVLPSLSTPYSQPNLTRVQTSVWPFSCLSQHLALNQTSLVYKPQFGRSPVSLNTLLPTKPHSCTNHSLAVLPSLSTPCSQPNLTRVQTSVWPFSRLSQHLALNQTSLVYKPQFGRSPVSLNILLSTKPCTPLSEQTGQGALKEPLKCESPDEVCWNKTLMFLYFPHRVLE